MSRPAFSRVEPTTWTAFGDTLRRAPWDAVDDLPIDTVEARVALLHAPLLAAHKAWLRWGIASLSGLLQADSVGIRVVDAEWDNAQRAFHFGLSAAELSEVEEKRAAARRLRETLLQGQEIAMTQATYEDELRFGLHQIHIAQEPNVQRDLAAAQLQEPMQRVETATRSLESALTDSDNIRSRATVQARSVACARAATALYSHLAFVKEQLGDSTPAHVHALLTSLQTLR